MSISFSHKSKTIKKVYIDKRTILTIKEGINYIGDHLSPTLEQYTCLEILKTENASISEFYSDIHIYEQFLSFATLQGVKCSKITLLDQSMYQDYDKNNIHYDAIQIIYIQREAGNFLKTKSHEFLFDYNSIIDNYPKIIERWYADKSELAPIRQHLISSIVYKGIFSSVEFLIVIQALEGFCTRFRNKKDTLADKLINIITEFSDIDKIKSDEIIIKQVVNSRNYYSHFMAKSTKPDVIDGFELYDLTVKLRKILICCVLHFLGLNHEQINDIFNRSNSNLLHH